MDFEIEYYRDDSGNNPVHEFLLGLVKKNKALFEKATQGIQRLRNRVYHREPLSKYLEPGLLELRVRSGTNILRIIYTFEKGRVIILLHIFIKKQQKTPENELEIARKRLKELKEKGVLIL